MIVGLSETIAPFVVLRVELNELPDADAEAEPDTEPDAEPDEDEEAAAIDETVTPADCLQVSAKEDNAVDLSLPEQVLWMSFCTVDASFEQMVL